MNIFESIKMEAATRLNHTAVVEGEDHVTYGHLISSVEKVAELLRQNGVDRLQRVGLLGDDSIDYIIMSLAILSIGAVIVPVSAEQTPEEIETVIDRIDVDFIIAEEKYRKQDRESHKRIDTWKKQFVLVKRSVREMPRPEYRQMNTAFIRFSSGTTGASKGVMLSHESIIERTNAADKGLQITAEDVVLWVLSMSYHFVVSILLFLRRGATIVLCGNPFPEALIEGVIKHRGTFIYASPFHYSLLSKADTLKADSLKGIRLAVSTAMKLPGHIADEFTDKFGLELTEAYGIIEVGLPFVRIGGGKEKRGSVGKPLSDYQIVLDNKDPDGIGEIRVKGPGMLDAYFSPWQSRADILADGWFKTGDLGKIDRDGFLFIVGRENDVINFVGMKIFAQEVEAVINRHPMVKESLVYGVAHPQYGHLPAAKIVLHTGVPGSDLIDDLRSFCYYRLANYKVPKEFYFVEQLPKTPSGKIRRRV